MKTYKGNADIARRVRNLGTECGRVVSFTTWLASRRERGTGDPLEKRLGGYQSQPGFSKGKVVPVLN
jgi:hypothetical protein